MYDVAQNNNQVTTYNGWCNRETWLVSLWLGSEPASQSMLERFANLQGSVTYRSEQLREEMEGLLSDNCEQASLWTDMLYTSLSRVDWREIIESCLS